MRMRRARYLAGGRPSPRAKTAPDCLCGPAIPTRACAPARPAERARTTAGTILPASGVLWRALSPFWIDLVGSDDGGWDGREEETQYPDYDGKINVEISPRTPKNYASGWARLASRPPGPGAEGEPSCRPVGGTAPFDKLLALWAQPEHDYPRRVSHGAAEVASLAAHYGVRLPDDFRDYLIHACSTVDDGGNMDAFMNAWWGLERIRSVSEECGEQADVVLGDGSAKTLLFADTLIWCTAWGICCEEGADFGRIFLAIDSCRFVADSFTEFVDRYVKDDGALY